MKDNRLLDGRAVRNRILDEVAARVRHVAATHAIGRLVSVTIGEPKEAAVYVRAQVRAAEMVGLRFESQTWPITLSQQECKARLVAMNDTSDVLGVILQRPVPSHSRPFARVRHPSAQGHRGHESGVDRRHRLQRSGARAMHGCSVGRVD